MVAPLPLVASRAVFQVLSGAVTQAPLGASAGDDMPWVVSLAGGDVSLSAAEPSGFLPVWRKLFHQATL